jgi:hypothetical protein
VCFCFVCLFECVQLLHSMVSDGSKHICDAFGIQCVDCAVDSPFNVIWLNIFPHLCFNLCDAINLSHC